MSDRNLGVARSDNFEGEVLKSDKPVLIDFWAPWCGPCKAIGPLVEEIAAEYQGKVKVMKLNVDDEQKLAMSYGVRSIPTLMMFGTVRFPTLWWAMYPKTNWKLSSINICESRLITIFLQCFPIPDQRWICAGKNSFHFSGSHLAVFGMLDYEIEYHVFFRQKDACCQHSGGSLRAWCGGISGRQL